MTADTPLGECPLCEEPISKSWILLKYQKDDGTHGIWAECPNCGDVVAPE